MALQHSAWPGLGKEKTVLFHSPTNDAIHNERMKEEDSILYSKKWAF
jgi:hypothetical protein